jgi:hypothetical protein
MVGYDIPMNANAAWILQLIKLKLKETDMHINIREALIPYITEMFVNASMTQVSRGEVMVFLNLFSESWISFKVYKLPYVACPKREKHTIDFHLSTLQNFLCQQYNKSIDGWQGNHVFEKKQTYDVRQTSQQIENNDKGGFFRNRKKSNRYVEEYEEE